MNPQIENENVIFVGQVINVPETPDEGESIHTALASGDGPLWYQVAFREMETGVDEISGPADNPRIVECFFTLNAGAAFAAMNIHALVAGPSVSKRRVEFESQFYYLSFGHPNERG